MSTISAIDTNTSNSPKRLIANTLSGMNFLCGIMCIMLALNNQFSWCFILLCIGAICDGLDGTAARRWGSTRWGVLADDIADGVTYGIAPGFAIYASVGAGIEGVVIGVLYALFTISRLVFFTINKNSSDPNYFAGAPSPFAGIVMLSAVVLFHTAHPVMIGLIAGIVAVQMVSYNTPYFHLGRALGKPRQRRSLGVMLAALLAVIAITAVLFGWNGPAGVVLAAGLTYGFLPMVTRFRTVVREYRASIA